MGLGGRDVYRQLHSSIVLSFDRLEQGVVDRREMGRNYHSLFVAISAPSAKERNFAITIDGNTALRPA